LAARGNASHEAQMTEHGIRPIDLVIVNLYPFSEAVAKGGDFATCIENIDIGGPCMIRASAKKQCISDHRFQSFPIRGDHETDG